MWALNNITNRTNQVQGIIYASSPHLNTPALTTIYNSLVYSVIIQSIIIYGKTHQSYIIPFKIAINKILRIILKAGRDENNVPLMSSNEMFHRLKILKFDDACNYFLTKFLRRALFLDLVLLQKYFINFLPAHSH